MPVLQIDTSRAPIMIDEQTIEKVIPDPPGNVRHGQVYRNQKGTMLVVGRLYYCEAGYFVQLVDLTSKVLWNYSLTHIDKCIEDKKLQEVELTKKDGIIF